MGGITDLVRTPVFPDALALVELVGKNDSLLFGDDKATDYDFLGRDGGPYLDHANTLRAVQLREGQKDVTVNDLRNYLGYQPLLTRDVFTKTLTEAAGALKPPVEKSKK